jgi:hypothetical protein
MQSLRAIRAGMWRLPASSSVRQSVFQGTTAARANMYTGRYKEGPEAWPMDSIHPGPSHSVNHVQVARPPPNRTAAAHLTLHTEFLPVNGPDIAAFRANTPLLGLLPTKHPRQKSCPRHRNHDTLC